MSFWQGSGELARLPCVCAVGGTMVETVLGPDGTLGSSRLKFALSGVNPASSISGHCPGQRDSRQDGLLESSVILLFLILVARSNSNDGNYKYL